MSPRIPRCDLKYSSSRANPLLHLIQLGTVMRSLGLGFAKADLGGT